MRTVLALDLGTSSCKAALYTIDGERIATAAASYPIHNPGPAMYEQSGEDYARAAQAAIAGLGVNAQTSAISFSTQTPTLIFCDDALKPLRPAVIWQDSRAADEAEFLLTRYSAGERREWFGMDLPISAASTPAKLLWIARHEPELWRRTRYVFQPKDHVAALLTGRPVTDAWCAKGMANVETFSTHPSFLKLLNKSVDPCPPILSATAQVGTVTCEAATSWSLAPGTPVMNGWSDALAGIFSTGACQRARTGFVITGTSEIIGMTRSEGPAHPGVFHVPAHLLPGSGVDLHFGPTQAGGSALEWLARITGRTAAELLALIPGDAGPSPILFRPHLAGERAPYWDHTLTASFEGLRLEHTAADLALAVVQGIAMQERLVLTCAESGVAADRVMLAGGAARHAGWNRVRANVLGCPVFAMRDLEASLRGAALIAWAGLGAVDLRTPPESWFAADRIDPDSQWAGPVTELMERFELRQRS